MKDDTISRQLAVATIRKCAVKEVTPAYMLIDKAEVMTELMMLPSAQPEIIQCKECKHNPEYEWFGCPMSHLNEKQRPETAWCWRGERRTDETD
jgi:hypothetical protein